MIKSCQKFLCESRYHAFSLTPPAEPLNIQVSNTSSTRLLVAWNLPPKRKRYGTIRYFSIRYRRVNCSSPSTNLTTWMFTYRNGKWKYIELKDLEKWSCYSVQLRFKRSHFGQWSKETQHQTSEDGMIIHIFLLCTLPSSLINRQGSEDNALFFLLTEDLSRSHIDYFKREIKNI